MHSTHNVILSLQSTVENLATQVAKLQKNPISPPSSSPSNSPKKVSTNPLFRSSSSDAHTHDQSYTSPFSISPIRIDITPCDGTNPLDWILQTERYFDIHHTPHHHRIEAASFFFRGEALSWFNWMYQNQQLTTSTKFTRAVELRFGPSSFTNHEATLYKHTQTSSVANYQTSFEALSNRVTGLSPRSLLNCFLSGLKPDIQRELQILRPTSITQATELARLI